MPVVEESSRRLRALERLRETVANADGFQDIVQSLRAGHSASVDGTWGSSAPLVASSLASLGSAAVLVVLAHPGDLEAWQQDLTTFGCPSPILFPAWDTLPGESSIPDEVAGNRLRCLRVLLAAHQPQVILTTIQALLQPVPELSLLPSLRRVVRSGMVLDPEELARWLVDRGFRRVEAVELPGEFCRRGGILDAYSYDGDFPIRIEYFGDEIESIRAFAPDTQRSREKVESAELLGQGVEQGKGIGGLTGNLCDYLPAGSWTVLVEPSDLGEQAKHYLERVSDLRGLFSTHSVFKKLLALPSVKLSAMPLSGVEAICHLRAESVERFSGEAGKVRDELDAAIGSERVIVACNNEAERHRLGEILGTGRLASEGQLELLIGRIHSGFRLVDARIVILSDDELFRRESVRVVKARKSLESRAIDSFLDLEEGDLVVHITHGIARYRGMKILEKAGRHEEHLMLEFREGTTVYVPSAKIDLVQKYVGGGKTDPELSKIGGTSWQRRKEKVQEIVFDLASEMIQLQATRAAKPGYACPADSDWQLEFEAAFPYRETPDQIHCLSDLKRDMEASRPMDRLICGDVGYGKTELAVRAAFKMIDNGRQVAVLVPTTVLAEQHLRTFGQRLAKYPFVVECLSRFRSGSEQRDIARRLAKGGIDVVIGTHRLLSKDIAFHDLGLVIIDEEQRFGVEHKERLKQLRQSVDVLTLTATPIPRTLHMSLLGIRDISNLETPPLDRQAIETRIIRFDPQLIRHAILREMNRDGQVYFVHNRVFNIHEIANKLRQIVPEAEIAIVHGQMPEDELEGEMLRFLQRTAHILVATTIIESGLDIPYANTIFINQADIYGLADLHQLRGRVGRYKHRAYAYLMLDSDRAITPNATKRLKAIEEFTELGAGFKIAMRDLEIRGAGNILGHQQSGHIAAVGYELYCQLLESSVRQLKNQPSKAPLEVNLDLPFSAYLPRAYVSDQKQRMDLYRRLSRVRKLDRLGDLDQEMRDRFGPIPEPVEWLFRLAELRILASRWGIESAHLEQTPDRSAGILDLVLKYRLPRKAQQLAQRSDGKLKVVDEKCLYRRLGHGETSGMPLYLLIKQLLRPLDESL